MKKLKNYIKKIYNFSINHKALLVFFVTFFALFFFYLGALAENNYDNKLYIESAKIEQIKDGIENFDSNDNLGNDSSNNNGIVRNFDDIEYVIDYDMQSKNIDEPITTTDRQIIVDVVFKNEVDGNILPPNNIGSIPINKINDSYSYAEFEVEEAQTGSNTFSFTLQKINMKNNDKIEPTILIKESTDETRKSLYEALLENEELNVETFLLENSNTSCENIINETTTCETTVTGKEKYTVKLFKGTPKKEQQVTTFPVGIMVALEVDPNKGIKGLLTPNNVEFDIDITSDSNTNQISYDSVSQIRPYTDELDYKVYIDESLTQTMPVVIDLSNSDSSMNGDISAEDKSGVFKHIKINGIKYSGSMKEIDGVTYNYLSTNSFEFKSTRTNQTLTSGVEDINITVSTVNALDTSSISLIDNYSKFVGEFKSNVDFYDINVDKSIDTAKQWGQAFFNYNHELYIRNTLNYATTVGDELENLTSYLKIDNDIINVIPDTNDLDANVSISASREKFELPENITSYYKLSFGYGSWDKNSFTLNNVENCPTNLNNLTKDELMNLYGGPCITEKANAITWSDFIDDSNENGVMLVKLVLADNDSYKVNPTTEVKLDLRAKIKNDYNLVNNLGQVTTLSTGEFNDENSTTKYYLTDTINTNGIENSKNKNNYNKTKYDFNNRGVTELNTNTCGNKICSITGNTILVTAYQTNKPTITTYRNDIPRTTFNYYPIEWRINDTSSRNDSSIVYTDATVYVYLPSYLKLVSASASSQPKDYVSSELVTLNDEQYLKLKYVFDNNDTSENIENLNSGILPELSIFTNIYMTTKSGSEPKVYAEVEFNGFKMVNDEQHLLKEVTPSSERTNTTENTVKIYNNNKITMLGTILPTNIEKNSSFTYKMQAYNNSETASNNDGYSFENTTLYYVLPYKEDSSYSENEAFTNQKFKIKLSNLPQGYEAYYTIDNSVVVLNEISSANEESNINWTRWNNVTNEQSNVTAIKVVKTGSFNISEYFCGEEGITATVTPVNNAMGDVYYNNFILVTDKPEGYYSSTTCSSEDEDCQDTYNLRKLYFQSTKSKTSVYSRKITGSVFEDYNYNGMHDETEANLQNIPVSVYKLSKTDFDSENPIDAISENDELVYETTTGVDGTYTVKGLEKGNYYVKFTFDNGKYTPAEKNQGIINNIANAYQINSKAVAVPKENSAVSDIISFTDNSQVEYNYINLGLRIRKEFNVEVNKYITNVTVFSNQNPISYDYDNATKVNIDIKNFKNTSFRVTYKFELKNTKYFPGYVGIIADKIPNGMTFDPEVAENRDWTYYDGVVYYTGYQKRLIIPGEKYYFTLVLDLTTDQGGSYLNIVAAQDLVLMGDEVSNYDFSSLNLFVNEENNNENNQENENNGE